MKNEMDNQQVTDLELGWLAGIIDGEGSISMRVWPYKNKIHFVVSIAVCNSSVELLNKVVDICSRLDVTWHWTKKPRPENFLQCWDIETKKISHCHRILNHILPLLTSKYEKAKLLQAFCIRRLGFLSQCDNRFELATKHPYNDDDWAFFKEFADKYHHHTRKVTSTTIPLGSRSQGLRSAGQAIA